jgi:hypothetical protein
VTTGLIAVVLPCVASWLWLRRIQAMSAAERIAAAFAFGAGLSGALFFIWRLAGGDLTVFRTVDAVGWTAALAAGLAMAPRLRRTAGPSAWGIGLLAIVLATVLLPVVIARVSAGFQGDWDAWAIWNLRARFLIEPTDRWKDAFVPALTWAHPNYPIHLPSSVARGWVQMGAPSVAIPIGLAVGATLAAIVAVTGSLYARAGAVAACTGLLLVATPAFVLLGTAQLADIWVGLFMVLAVIFLAMPPTMGSLASAGLAMGLAAWSKNEGLTAAVAIASSFSLVRVITGGWRRAWRDALAVAIGLLPMLVVLALFKTRLAPPSELVARAADAGAWNHWTNPARLTMVVVGMARGLAGWGGWPVLGPVWCIPLVILAWPGSRAVGRNPMVYAAGLALVMQMLVFFSVYVMTPFDPAWHLGTSWSRLILQLWPTTVWWACAWRAPAAPS